jgi:hypothetical protein
MAKMDITNVQSARVRLGQFDQRNAAGGHAGEAEAVHCPAVAANTMTDDITGGVSSFGCRPPRVGNLRTLGSRFSSVSDNRGYATAGWAFMVQSVPPDQRGVGVSLRRHPPARRGGGPFAVVRGRRVDRHKACLGPGSREAGGQGGGRAATEETASPTHCTTPEYLTSTAIAGPVLARRCRIAAFRPRPEAILMLLL